VALNMGIRNKLRERRTKREIEKLWKKKLKEQPIAIYDARGIGMSQPFHFFVGTKGEGKTSEIKNEPHIFSLELFRTREKGERKMNRISSYFKKRKEHKAWKRNFEAQKTRDMLAECAQYHRREMNERTRRT